MKIDDAKGLKILKEIVDVILNNLSIEDNKIPAFSTNQKVPPTIKKTNNYNKIIPIPNNKRFGVQLAFLRKDDGYTVNKLASLSGVGSSTIEAHERGCCFSIKESTLNKLAKALRVTPSQMLENKYMFTRLS